MAEKNILIIGASRGIGLGLTCEFAARGWHVFASQRSPSKPLAQAVEASGGRIEQVTADVTDDTSIADLTRTLTLASLDALILNAGTYGPGDQSILAMGREDVADIIMTNAVGPARAAVMLLPLLRDGATLGMMSSKMGSITDSSGGANHYRISKVMQNMLSRSLFEQHAKERQIAVLSLHPGWVQTDMGGTNAPLTIEQSARGLVDVIERQHERRHEFVAYDGSAIPW